MTEQSTNISMKELKRQRNRGYFINATKHIIITDGVESVSVRGVAEAAGYTYATLYSYFTDLNELLWDTKQDMIHDVVKTMLEKTSNIPMNSDGLKQMFADYTSYYLQNPNVFKFFYFHKLIQPDRPDTMEEPDFNGMMVSAFQGLVQEGKLMETEVEAVGHTCIYAIHGLLTLYLSGNGNLTEEGVLRELDKILGYML